MTTPPQEAAPADAAAAGTVTPAPAELPLGPLRRTVREVGLGLITLGVIVFLFVGYQLWGTNITEAHNQHKLAQQFQAEVANHQATPTTTPAPGSHPATSPTTALPTPPAGGAIEHLVIPKIGLDKFVVEGTNEADLRRGPGHYTGTAYPGQVGNVAIAGHRTTYGAPFFDLDHLAPGDPIYITDLTGHTWLYRVWEKPQVVSPDDVSVLDPTKFAQLTLTTCNPRFSATTRLIVFARLSGPAAAAAPTTLPARTPATLPASGPSPSPKSSQADNPTLAADNLGHGESSAWTPTILYGLLVVAMWVAVRIWINRTRRWHRLAAVIVGIGVCLVPLWFCFENAILLLPQSI